MKFKHHGHHISDSYRDTVHFCRFPWWHISNDTNSLFPATIMRIIFFNMNIRQLAVFIHNK